MTRAQKTEYLRTLYDYRCGYCGTTEAQEQAILTRDHFRPIGLQGRNSVDNMVYACLDCNQAKGDYWSDLPEKRLLHPLQDDLTKHLRYKEDGTVSPRTHQGSVYVCVLDLNRSKLVQVRTGQIIQMVQECLWFRLSKIKKNIR